MPNILVIDDDKHIAQLIVAVIETYRPDWGAHCFNACDDDVMRWMLTNKPDLIIFDYMLGATTCKEHLSKIREINPYMPFLICTAWQAEVVARSCGVDDYISKPFEIEHLLEKIESILYHPNMQCGSVFAGRSKTS